MALNPIPFTLDPEDGDSPRGAIPVTIFGIEDILDRLDQAESRLTDLEGDG